jgi:ubiquinone biosynthesis protein COQ9
MFDQTTPKGRVLAAALDCAAKKSWADVTLLDIAEAAQLPLGALRDIAASKSDVLAQLVRAVDDEVLKRAPKRSEGQEPRDVLFDIVMTRFDVLGPHKAALKSIRGSGAAADARLTRALLASQHWMLQAAGIGTDGPTGGLRISGLAMVYASVFRVWLDDDDPGHARTMAALDRRLRRGERSLGSIEQVCSVLQRFATDGPSFLRSVLRGRSQAQPGPTPDAGTTAGTL